MTSSMDAATRAALEGSIAKWQAIVDGTGEDQGRANCPLCGIFLTANRICGGCPVAERTGMGVCGNTPYAEFFDLAFALETNRATTPDLKAAAQAELDFLISLRPEGEKP